MNKFSGVADWGWLAIGAQLIAGCGAPAAGDSDRDEAEQVGETKAAFTARDCSWSEMNAILAPPTPDKDVAHVACNFTYPRDPQAFMQSGQTYPGEIRKPIQFDGAGAVGITFDCKGHRINADSGKAGRAIQVATTDDGLVPHHIKIQNCEVNGNIGLVHGSYTICSGCSDPGADAIARRQSTAPHHIILKNLRITTRPGGNGVHFETGVTFSTLINSRVQGSNMGTNNAIYLSPESANNAIVGNFIAVDSETREQIAIDGSANNYIADNDLSALNHGGIFIFRNCGEGGTVRIQKPWNNSIVNNRFYYEDFDMGGFLGINSNWEFPSIWVASRTIWVAEPFGGGHLGNVKDRVYCNDDAQYPFGSGIDNTDNAKYTLAAQNQVRKGRHDLSVAEMFRGPVEQDLGSLPFNRTGNAPVDELTKVPTKANGVAGEPPVQDSLYLVQGSRLWRSDAVSGVSVALKTADWAGSTAMTVLGDRLYVVQGAVLYEVDPATGDFRPLRGATWSGATAMTSWGGKLFIVQDDRLWYVDDFSTGLPHPLSERGAWAGTTSMTALGAYLYIVEDSKLWKVNPLTGDYDHLGGPDWYGPTSMTSLSLEKALYIIQDGTLWRVADLQNGTFSHVGPFGAWQGATSMTSMKGRLYVIQDRMLWVVDPSTGGYAPIERPHWDYSGPTVMAALTTNLTLGSDMDPGYSNDLKPVFVPFIP